MARPKKSPAKEDNSVELELLARIDAAKFDRAGLRKHDAPLHRDEIDFLWVQPWEAEEVAMYEYCREMKRSYDAHRLLLKGDFATLKKSKGELIDGRCLSLFPLPYGEIARLFTQDERKTVVERLGAIVEIDQDWLDQGMLGNNPSLSFHRLRINWSRGRDAIKRELAAWIDSLDRPTIQRRTKARIIEDRLDQLAAYRAHRAGLHQGEFAALKPRLSYSDATAYRRAWQKGEAILKSFLKG